MTAILVHPRYLFKVEPAPEAPEASRPLDDWEIATRLSYFLKRGDVAGAWTRRVVHATIERDTTYAGIKRRHITTFWVVSASSYKAPSTPLQHQKCVSSFAIHQPTVDQFAH